MTSIQDKLKGLQQTQQTMRVAVEGPTMEKLVDEVQWATMQSVVEVIVVQVGLGGLRSKITTPVE